MLSACFSGEVQPLSTLSVLDRLIHNKVVKERERFPRVSGYYKKELEKVLIRAHVSTRLRHSEKCVFPKSASWWRYNRPSW